MRKIPFLAPLLFLISCFNQENKVFGKYEYEGKQTIDSIILEKNVYTHKIFDKQGRLMYQGNSTWKLEDNRIIFFNFYNNEDYKLTEFLTEEQAKKFLMSLSCPIYNDGKTIIVEANADENIKYYKK
ncbi:hypothetical protein ABXT08_20895 [Chryseobacterium sp. NRRL B-14859]|uniref:hypothetical protein n=1 Tax=Chryseobacterium sp. NRRL B-14859 TaxID=1562763 RepID=UPI00339B3F9D